MLALLAACQPASTPEGEEGAKPSSQGRDGAAQDTASAVLPRPLGPLRRAELLAAAAAAADATAMGQALPDTNKALTGRLFTLRLPFGCDGPAERDERAWATWSFDATTRTLRLSTRPEQWGDAAWIADLAGNTDHDAVEGFWIRHPWTTSEECPRPALNGGSADAPQAPPPVPGPAHPESVAPPVRQTLGIAQFFSPLAPRVLQRGARPYAHTQRVPESQEIASTGFRLGIAGRVSAFADGQPIHCLATSPDLEPVCIIAVEFSRIAFEQPASGETIAEWRN